MRFDKISNDVVSIPYRLLWFGIVHCNCEMRQVDTHVVCTESQRPCDAFERICYSQLGNNWNNCALFVGCVTMLLTWTVGFLVQYWNDRFYWARGGATSNFLIFACSKTLCYSQSAHIRDPRQSVAVDS